MQESLRQLLSLHMLQQAVEQRYFGSLLRPRGKHLPVGSLFSQPPLLKGGVHR